MTRSDAGGRRRRTTLYRDADGQVTADPAEAVRGEVVHVDVHGSTRRTRFFLQREDLPWLPVSEPAFLLWVLVALVLAWIAIALLLVLV
jgi:hypothetical protein